MDEILKTLAERLRTYESEVLTADEVVLWPEGILTELASQKVLAEIQPASGLICDQC